jgi:site-specific DNA-methyltransferase (adenine-specific)
MEKVTIGTAELWHGECQDVLPLLGQVDAVMTDLPYSQTTHSNAKSNRGAAGTGVAAIDFAAIDNLLRLLHGKCDGWIVANMDWWHIAELARQTRDDWELVRFGVWVKTNPMPQISADRPAPGWDGIAYIFPVGKKKYWHGGGMHGNWIGPLVTDGAHPTGKPLAMLCQWVDRFTTWGQTVLDPFMGSGTGGHACALHGRKFIGIERDRRYFDSACERIAAAQAQPTLLEPAAEPVQAGLL